MIGTAAFSCSSSLERPGLPGSMPALKGVLKRGVLECTGVCNGVLMGVAGTLYCELDSGLAVVMGEADRGC